LLVLALVLFIALAPSIARADLQDLFVPGESIHATASGAIQCTGHFNQDLNADLAICDRYAGQLHVWVGNGDGSFTFSTTMGVPGQPVSGSVMDINGDGKDDLVVCLEGPANSIQILIGDGAGGLSIGASIPTMQAPNTVVGTDWDGDGDTDLAVAITRVGDARCILYENNAGTFVERQNLVIGDRTSTHNLVLADYDLDGDTDVAMATTDGNSVRVIFNDGDWNVHVGPPFSPPTLYALGGIEGADLDGDGDTDLVSCNNNSHGYAVFLNNGDGTFAVQDWIISDWSSPAGTAVGDYDRDCKLDLAVSDYGTNKVYILHGNGDGTFVHPPMASYAVNGAGRIERADLNRDGVWDLSIGCVDGYVRTLIGRTADFLVPGPENDISATDATGVNLVVGRINGDVHQDYVVLDRAKKQLQVWLGDGDTGFSMSNLLTLVGQPVSGTLLHVDGDSAIDLVVCLESPANAVQVLYGDGTGNFCPAQRIDAMPVPNSVATGDLDGDGDADLAVGVTRVDDARCILYENVGGTFVERGNWVEGDRTSGKNLVVADFDGDGDLDVAMATTNGRSVRVLFNDGDWNFHLGPPFSPPSLYALNGIEPGDFDEDGDIDLVSCNNNSHGFAIFLNNGDGTFVVTDQIVEGWASPAFCTVMDVDWDCHLDVVVPDYGTDQVYVLRGMGDGTFEVLSTNYPVADAGIGFAGDFDEDTLQDVVFACGDGVVRMLLGNHDAWPSPTISVGEPGVNLAEIGSDGFGVFPNPGGSHRQMAYALVKDSLVQIRIVDVSGRVITTVQDGMQKAGTHQVAWDGRDDAGRLVSSGAYFAEMRNANGVQRRSFRLVR
jgi:hypothetical protein